jgi:SAM-dependent methyltransferase
MCDVSVYSAARAGVAKSKPCSAEEVARQLDLLLAIAAQLGYEPRPGDRVLDLGCGIGSTVEALLARGLDAYGVDVGEWWGQDFPSYWHDSPIPPEPVRQRLSCTTEKNYRLPYPDGHFDLIVSSQVFEHVFNYVDVFRELGRVAKPGAVSLHLFPGPGSPMEPHLLVPVIPLTRYHWWLRLWALVKRRHRPTWREEFEFLRESMRSNNYPTRAQLHAFAAAAGVRLSFREELYIEAAEGSRPWKLTRMAPILAPLVRRTCQRAMVINQPATPSSPA